MPICSSERRRGLLKLARFEERVPRTLLAVVARNLESSAKRPTYYWEYQPQVAPRDVVSTVSAFSCEARCTARDGASLLVDRDAPQGPSRGMRASSAGRRR